MSVEYIEVDLNNEEKQVILKLAPFFVTDPITNRDLQNKRKKWIRFHPMALTDVIGELAYHFNRSRSNYQYHLLDELIDHMENYEKRGR